MEYFANVAILVVLGFLFYSIFKTQGFSKKHHDHAIHKMDTAIRKQEILIQHQEKANQHLAWILHEIRRSNQFLAELVGIEGSIQEIPETTTATTAPSSPPPLPPIDLSMEESTESDNVSQAKVYVGNIDYAATEEELAEYFAPYGHVESVNIPLNRYTGRARGFGFVSFATTEEAERAMALNGSEFKGRQIQVNFAKEREKTM